MAENFDYNYLKNNAFTFAVERLPQTMFRVVTGELPSISITPPSAGDIASTQYFPGTAIEFEPLTLEFIVDDDLLNYEELYDWITDQQFATRKTIFTPADNLALVSDGVLVTMNRSSNANRSFHFKGMFPISLGSLQFTSTIDSPEPIRCQVTFRYSYFSMNPLK